MRKYNVIIWGLGKKYTQYFTAIKLQEVQGIIHIVGVTDKDRLYDRVDGYDFIPFDELDKTKIDYVVVTTDKYYLEIRNEILELGLNPDQIILAKVFQYPWFNFERYIELSKSKVSIIANNCWGGITYNSLGMEFYSPFINMFEEDDDYLRLIYNLDHYLNSPLELVKYRYNPELDINYPVCRIDDVVLYFNHYSSWEDAKEKWNERVKRINSDNIFIMMFTDEEDNLNKFADSPHCKKVCFTSLESERESVLTIPKTIRNRGKRLYEDVNGMALNRIYVYNPIELLLNGTPNQQRIDRI